MLSMWIEPSCVTWPVTFTNRYPTSEKEREAIQKEMGR